MINNKKILILGGAGFIGYHLSKFLSHKKFNNTIYILDNFKKVLKDKNFNELLKKKKM